MTVRTRNARQSANPMADAQPGERLALGDVMTLFKVSMGELGDASGMSKTAVFNLVSSNAWPATQDKAEIRIKVENHLREKGASEELIAVIWRSKGFVRQLPKTPTDVAAAAALTPSTPQPPVKATDMLLAKQTLSYAASRAFALFQNPFDGEVTSTDELFTNGELRFIREAMWQAGRNGRFVAVLGESGSGKTTLLADLEDRIARDRAQLTIIRPSVLSMTESETTGRLLKAADIITAIILTLDANAVVPQTHEARTRKMLRMVEESAKVGNAHLLVIEEAHALPINTAKALKRLHEACRVGRKPALGILLLGQPELRSKLNERRADMREVVQRCEVVELPALVGDARAYLEHRAQAQGKKLADLIDASGLAELEARLTVVPADKRMSEVSLLYPLAMNNLMTAALNKAASIGAPLVTRDVVRAV